jgi:putative peptidoglycan lipid II flippase
LGLLVVIVLAGRIRGGYTAYASAYIFFQLPYAIFAVSIMTALLPSLSSRWTAGDVGTFRAQLAQGIRGTGFIVIPAVFGYIALALPIVRVLLQHGVMGRQSTDLLAAVLQIFSLGLFPFCVFQLQMRAFYAMQDTRTPAIINFFATAINAVADVVFVRFLNVEGLALGLALAYAFAAITAAVILRGRLGGLLERRLWSSLARITVGGVLAGGAAYLVSIAVGRTLGTASLGPEVLQVGGGVLAGVAVFLAAAVAFRMEELVLIKQMVLERVRRR